MMAPCLKTTLKSKGDGSAAEMIIEDNYNNSDLDEYTQDMITHFHQKTW